MSTIHNNIIGFPEISASSIGYLRPPSSLSLPSNSGDSGFLPSRYGSATASTTNINTGINSTSGNTSVRSSPIPTEQDIDQILRKAVELLTLRNEALKQQTNHLRSKRLPPFTRKSPKPDSYKTVMCQAWLESGICNFAENCRFAHGEEELRPCNKLPMKNPKYKTKLCDKYTMAGLCPYGDRCLFIHPEASNASNPYIRPDRERALLTSFNNANSKSSQILLSNHTTINHPPPPSWPLESPAFFSAHRDLDQLLNLDYSTENMKSLLKESDQKLVAKNMDHTLVLSDITNQTMLSVQATPNSISSASNSKMNIISHHDSPDSGISFHDYNESTTFRAPIISQSDAQLSSSDYPFQFAIHADNLARSLACEFKID
uniref:C3H1-type domain-containing protein n=1 Tax=Brugia malayi TaxID=6279 RepID=A0A7I4KMX7_BRUMA